MNKYRINNNLILLNNTNNTPINKTKNIISFMPSQPNLNIKYPTQTIKINKNYLYIIIVSCGQNTISATNEATTANMKHTIINKFDNHEEILGEKQDKEIDRKKIIPTGLLCTKAMLEATNSAWNS